MQPSFFNQEHRKARKEHSCYECRCEIRKGETYQYTFGIWRGEPDYFKICSVCEWTRDKLNLDSEDDEFGNLWENVYNCGHAIDRNMVRAKLRKNEGACWLQLEHTFNVGYDTLKQWIADVEKMEKERA
jgi:hypothetical protein